MTAQNERMRVPVKIMSRPSRFHRDPRRLFRTKPRAKLPVRIVQTLAVLAGAVAIWQIAVMIVHPDPVIFPRPAEVAKAMKASLWVDPSSRLSYLPHIWETLKEVLYGYVMGCTAGLALAVVSIYIRWFDIVARPFVVAFQSMPKIALAPLIVVWFGFGSTSKIVLVVVATFFPLYVNGLVGLRSVDLGLIRMMRSFNATSFQIFRKVQIFAALPFIFAGLEIAVVHAVTSAVAAEFLGGQEGLGVRIIQSEQTLDVPSIFGELFVLALIGVLLNSIIAVVRKRTVTWTGERLLLEDQ
jgi:NitT/TauT family transport system permease protein